MNVFTDRSADLFLHQQLKMTESLNNFIVFFIQLHQKSSLSKYEISNMRGNMKIIKLNNSNNTTNIQLC